MGYLVGHLVGYLVGHLVGYLVGQLVGYFVGYLVGHQAQDGISQPRDERQAKRDKRR